MIKSEVLTRKEINSNQWDEFVEKSPQYIIYSTCGYLDSVCPNWSAIIITKNNEWLAVMPINISTKNFVSYSLKPAFVQYTGILFKPINEKKHREVYIKKICIQKVIDAIPKNVKLFNQNFSPEFDYFIPFYWNKFLIQPFHSYCLSLEDSIENIENNFSDSVAKRMAKEERYGLHVVENNSIDALISLMLDRKIINEEDAHKLRTLWDYIISINAGFTIYVTDPKTNKVYSGGAFIIDKERVIFLSSALDLRYKNTGAQSLLIRKGIRKAHSLGNIKIFDFDGSMIESLENYNRSFGATPINYFNISKNDLPIVYKIGYFLKSKWRGKKKLKPAIKAAIIKEPLEAF
ncbi:MAG: hypothetical protein NTX03_03160 [Bacteroidetes bacterium]|nr:hypothetical protein [Bacteroidota bacterium]